MLGTLLPPTGSETARSSQRQPDCHHVLAAGALSITCAPSGTQAPSTVGPCSYSAVKTRNRSGGDTASRPPSGWDWGDAGIGSPPTACLQGLRVAWRGHCLPPRLFLETCDQAPRSLSGLVRLWAGGSLPFSTQGATFRRCREDGSESDLPSSPTPSTWHTNHKEEEEVVLSGSSSQVHCQPVCCPGQMAPVPACDCRGRGPLALALVLVLLTGCSRRRPAPCPAHLCCLTHAAHQGWHLPGPTLGCSQEGAETTEQAGPVHSESLCSIPFCP